jgi:hypothetical protein
VELFGLIKIRKMETKSIYLTVRIDIQCPDGYNGSDEELLSELAYVDAAVNNGSECKIDDCVICGINEQ